MGKKRICRTSEGLRNVLFDEIERLINGESNPAKARAISQLVNVSLKSVDTEIQYQKYISELPHNGESSLGALRLGTDSKDEETKKPKENLKYAVIKNEKPAPWKNDYQEIDF